MAPRKRSKSTSIDEAAAALVVACEQTCGGLETKIKRVEEDLRQKTRDYQDLLQSNDEKASEISSQKEQLTSLKTRLDALVDGGAYLESQLSMKRQLVQRLKGENDYLKEMEAQSRWNLHEATRGHEECQKSLQAAEIKLQKSTEQASKDNTRLSSAVSGYDAVALSHLSSIAELKAKLQELTETTVAQQKTIDDNFCTICCSNVRAGRANCGKQACALQCGACLEREKQAEEPRCTYCRCDLSPIWSNEVVDIAAD